MPPIVCGRVGDRPWGQTLAAISARRASGQLAVVADDKRYVLAFADGMLVGAASPATADSVARIALTQHLVIASQVPAIAQRIAASPGRDELAVLGEVTQLPAEQLDRLRSRVLVQRAARTFALDDGEYALEPAVTIATGGSAELAEVLFVGARQFLAEERLIGALRELGSRFALAPDLQLDLARFGFGAGERPVLEALTRGTSLPELEAHHRDVDPRAAQAVIYALAMWGALAISGEASGSPVPPRAPTVPPAVSRTMTARASTTSPPAVARTRTPNPPPVVARASSVNLPPAVGRAPSANVPPAIGRAPSPTIGRAPSGEVPQDWPIASRTTSTRRTALAARELELILERKAQLLAAKADYFQLLGVPPDAASDTVLSALALLERQLHPDRLAELRLDELAAEAARVLGELRAAADVLADPARRAAYQARSQTPVDPAAEAKEAYRRAELLMRADRPDKAVAELERACELAPDHPTYRAARAWAKFCAASDKIAIADDTRKQLAHAASHSDEPHIPTFWLGRVERILGREREALRHFQVVLVHDPGHKDAASEVRILEARLRR